MLTAVGRAAARRAVVWSGFNRTLTTTNVTRSPFALRPAEIRNFSVSPWSSAAAKGASAAIKKKKNAASAKGRASALKKAAAAKKKAAAAKKKEREAEKKRKAKEAMTPEKKEKAKIKQLRETALLKEEPKLLPYQTWTLFVSERMPTERARAANLGDAIRTVRNEFNELPSFELQRLESQATSNREANARARKAWIDSLPVEVVYLANRARGSLSRLLKKRRIAKLDDERLPSRPATAYVQFILEASDFNGGVPPTEVLKDTAQKWKALSESDKSRFEEEYARRKADYDSEMNVVKSKAKELEKDQKASAKAAA